MDLVSVQKWMQEMSPSVSFKGRLESINWWRWETRSCFLLFILSFFDFLNKSPGQNLPFDHLDLVILCLWNIKNSVWIFVLIFRIGLKFSLVFFLFFFAFSFFISFFLVLKCLFFLFSSVLFLCLFFVHYTLVLPLVKAPGGGRTSLRSTRVSNQRSDGSQSFTDSRIFLLSCVYFQKTFPETRKRWLVPFLRPHPKSLHVATVTTTDSKMIKLSKKLIKLPLYHSELRGTYPR